MTDNTKRVLLKDTLGNFLIPYTGNLAPTAADVAAVDKLGVIKPDGTTTSVAADGTLSVIGGGAGGTSVYSLGMPSNQTENITLGNSGWTYTAPDDGYIMLCKRATSTGQYFDGWVNNGTDHVYGCSNVARDNNAQGIIFLPMKKGSKINVYYNYGGTTEHSHFIYADKSETTSGATILPDGYTITVATDGSGDFTDIQSALNSLNDKVCTGTVAINLKAGDTFTTTSAITFPSRLQCGELIIKGDINSHPTIECTNASAHVIHIDMLRRVYNISIKNIDIVSTNKSNGLFGIVSETNQNLVYCENVNVSGAGSAFHAQQIATMKLVNCGASNCTIGISNQASIIYVNAFTANNVTTIINAWAGGYTCARGTLTKTGVTNTFSISKNQVNEHGIIFSSWS